MAAVNGQSQGKLPDYLEVLRRVKTALDSGQFPHFNLKPLQVKCLEYILEGQDVIAVLPTGFGKSLMFHLLPYFLPVKKTRNIIIVVCPLNAIIEDQLKVLTSRGITTNTLACKGQHDSAEPLFSTSLSNEDDRKNLQVPDDILNGQCSIVFAHPEALLSEEGRQLMASQVYQENVAACVIDEAHCVELWGEEFRKDFKDLSSLKAFFPPVPTLALTATAPPHLVEKLRKSLMLSNTCKIVAVNPNKPNIYLDKKIRLSNHLGNESYRAILEPIAFELASQREKYPMTIIYLKLKYCGYAYTLFEKTLKENQFVGESKEPTARLFAQFHSPQTKRMKKELIQEIKRYDSRVRVIFATSALGMGVDTPYVTNIIHISPPSTIEAYMQEIGRAGRIIGFQAKAVLYYNNSDIGKNKLHIDQSMKDYCSSKDECQRKQILQYFGFKPDKQSDCCCVCDSISRVSGDVIMLPSVRQKVRVLPSNKRNLVREAIRGILSSTCAQDCAMPSLFNVKPPDVNNVVEKVMDDVEYITCESDLLSYYGILDDASSSEIFSTICRHASPQ